MGFCKTGLNPEAKTLENSLILKQSLSCSHSLTPFFFIMTTHPDLDNGICLSKRSSLYREIMAERKQIEAHKWLESEKAGKDIGFEQALFSWVRYHRSQWLKIRRNRSNKED